jgi:hypothetical protein
MTSRPLDMRSVTIVAAVALVVGAILWTGGLRGTWLALFIGAAVSTLACGIGARSSPHRRASE